MKSVLSTEPNNYCLSSTQINVKAEFAEEEEKPLNTYKTKRRRSNANSENTDDPDGKFTQHYQTILQLPTLITVHPKVN